MRHNFFHKRILSIFGNLRERFRFLLEDAAVLGKMYGQWFWAHFRRELRRYPFWLMVALAASKFSEILLYMVPSLISYRLAYSRLFRSICGTPILVLYCVELLGEQLFPTSPFYTEVFTTFAGFPLQALYLAFLYVVVICGLRESRIRDDEDDE